MSNLLTSRSGDGVLTITLNRPDIHNAFDDQLILELTQTLEAAGADNSNSCCGSYRCR